MIDSIHWACMYEWQRELIDKGLLFAEGRWEAKLDPKAEIRPNFYAGTEEHDLEKKGN